jgi:DNA repair exonuclease SbcCD ATPase subunit
LQHVYYGTTSRGIKKKGIVCTVPQEDPDIDDSFWAESIIRNDSGKFEGRWLVKQHQPTNSSMKVEVLKEIDGDWSKKWHGGGCPPRSVDAQKLASEIIGLRQNEFEGCLYLSQSGAHTLIEGLPSERMLYLSRLFGIDVCDDIHAKLKENLKKIENDLIDVIGMEARQKDLHDRIASMRPSDRIDESISQLKDASKYANDSLAEWQESRDKARDDIKTANNREEIQKELNELGALDLDQHEHTEKNLQNMSDRRDEVRDAIQAAKLRDSVEKQIAELEPEISDVPTSTVSNVDELLERKQSERAKLTADLTVAKERISLEEQLDPLDEGLDAEDIEERIGFVEKSLEVKRQKYKEDTDQHKELSDLIEAAGKGDCPTCHRPLDIDDMTKMRDKLEENLQVLYEEIQEPKKKASILRTQLVEARKVKSIKDRLADIGEHDIRSLREQRAKLKTEISRMTSIRDKVNEISSLKQQLEAMPHTGDSDALKAELSDIEEKLPSLKELAHKLNRAVFLTGRLDKLRKVDLKQAEHDLAMANESYSEIMEDLEKLHRELAVVESEKESRLLAETELKSVDADLASLGGLRRRKRVLEYAVDSIPRLKKRKLHKVVCAIRDVLPRYAGTMFSHEPNTTFIVSEDEESMELVCRRLVKVHGSLEPVLVPVKGFSGGEKQRLSVALLFTLHALLDPTKRPDLLVLDEVDKGLDEKGVASLMALVNEVRTQYGTVIMTSHRTEISGADFDRVWSVTKTNEESKLSLGA